ncbi:hypothetical protein L207DRAFT_536093 [Hyaloscypha variabilis F]|uniref:Uncharacterized protein n=1 Tax=Hyaloscypha variabilis (strain UAMH 11265 / GT02V1 / F) TaxID=1149755 RepID=A0A2J6R2Q8_HYAVF|nr:hypothetical protein L207DRAFT_536093 [Hyaloscypha variabilis F]
MYHCAGRTPMDASSISDVRSGVVSIIREFAGAYEAFKKWRKGPAGKKAVGQEECETSLYEGRTAIEGTLNHFSFQHGARFDTGDKTSLDTIINIQKRFREAVIDVLTSAVVERRGNNAKLEPVVLRVASEAAKKDTILAMDELSNRILAEAAGPFRATDPGDVLPPMPLRPVRPPRSPGPNLNLSQASLAPSSRPGLDSPVQRSGSASSSQTSLKVPLSPAPERNTIYSPAAGWKMPKFIDTEDSSTALVRTSSTRSAFDRWFPPTPKVVRPYHDIDPLEPTAPVVPSLKCDEESWDILKEGEAAVQRSWAAANDTVNEGKSRSYPHSAPLLQGPFASIWDDEPDPRPRTPLLYEREATPPTPEDDSPSLLISPPRAQNRPASAEAGKRIRSEPMLQFSAPAPRVRRHWAQMNDV